MDSIEDLLSDVTWRRPTDDEVYNRLVALGSDEAAPVLLRNIYREIGTEAEIWSATGFVLEKLVSLYPKILVDTLRDPDFEARAGAAYAMWWLDEARSIEALVKAMLTDPHPEVQYCAMSTLYEQARGLSGQVGIYVFAVFLKHDEKRFRSLASSILGDMGDATALPLLIPVLDDPVDNVRISAIKALGKLASPDAVPHLLRILQTDKAGPIWAAVIDMLGVLKAEAAVPELIKCLGELGEGYRHGRLCDHACLALERIGTKEALEVTVKMAERRIQPKVIRRLGVGYASTQPTSWTQLVGTRKIQPKFNCSRLPIVACLAVVAAVISS